MTFNIYLYDKLGQISGVIHSSSQIQVLDPESWQPLKNCILMVKRYYKIYFCTTVVLIPNVWLPSFIHSSKLATQEKWRFIFLKINSCQKIMTSRWIFQNPVSLCRKKNSILLTSVKFSQLSHNYSIWTWTKKI